LRAAKWNMKVAEHEHKSVLLRILFEHHKGHVTDSTCCWA